jgi:ribonuclease HI
MASHYYDRKPIAIAEMAAVLLGLSWAMTHQIEEPTTLTLATDSSVVYYSLLRGTGITLQHSPLLQELYVNMYRKKIKAGHGLAIRWVPSEQNLADPLSRGFHA